MNGETHTPVRIRGPLLSGEFQIMNEAPAPFTSFAPWVQDLIRQHLDSYEWEDGDRILVETHSHYLFTISRYGSKWWYEGDAYHPGREASYLMFGERIIDVFRFSDEGQEQVTHDWQVGDIVPALTRVGRPWLGRTVMPVSDKGLLLIEGASRYDREILWIDDRP